MGDVTLPQAKACFRVLLAGKEVTAHFEALLGEGGLATIEDFGKQDSGALDRCEATLRHIDECSRRIWDTIVDRPRQHEIDFDAEKADAAGRAADEESKKKALSDRLAGREGGAVDDAIEAAKAEGEARTGGYEVPEDDENGG